MHARTCVAEADTSSDTSLKRPTRASTRRVTSALAGPSCSSDMTASAHSLRMRHFTSGCKRGFVASANSAKKKTPHSARRTSAFALIIFGNRIDTQTRRIRQATQKRHHTTAKQQKTHVFVFQPTTHERRHKCINIARVLHVEQQRLQGRLAHDYLGIPQAHN
eukprot:Opistho-2@91483